MAEVLVGSVQVMPAWTRHNTDIPGLANISLRVHGGLGRIVGSEISETR